MSDLVGNPEDRFSHNEAHIVKIRKLIDTPVSPNFTILKWDVRGCILHACVIRMWAGLDLRIRLTSYKVFGRLALLRGPTSNPSIHFDG